MLITPEFKGSNYVKLLEEVIPNLKSFKNGEVKSEKIPTLRYIIHNSDQSISGLSAYKEHLVKFPSASDKQRLDEINYSLKNDEPINIQFTR